VQLLIPLSTRKHRDTEVAMLATCAFSKLAGVTTSLGLSEAKDALILTPVGIHFARSSKSVVKVFSQPGECILCTGSDLC